MHKICEIVHLTLSCQSLVTIYIFHLTHSKLLTCLNQEMTQGIMSGCICSLYFSVMTVISLIEEEKSVLYSFCHTAVNIYFLSTYKVKNIAKCLCFSAFNISESLHSIHLLVECISKIFLSHAYLYSTHTRPVVTLNHPQRIAITLIIIAKWL